MDKFGMKIKLPFQLHIKDIPNTFFDQETINVTEFYSGEFSTSYKGTQKLEDYFSYIKLIDLNNFAIDDFVREYEEDMRHTPHGYVFTNYTSLYSFLINYLNFSEVDFILIRNFIVEQQSQLVSQFSDMLIQEIGIKQDKDNITEAFMLLRGAFESSFSGALFPENKNKCYSEYSYREIIIQRLYFARKCEIEKAMLDESKKKFKNNKGE